MSRCRRVLIAGFSLLLLAGCLGGRQAPLQIVDLPSARELASEPAPSAQLQLTVALPTSSALLDSPRVLVRQPSGELAYLSGLAWPDAAPRLLQDSLIGALHADPRLAAVERQGYGLRGDYLVHLQLQQLLIDYQHGPQLQLAWTATLARSSDGRALARRRFSQHSPLAATAALPAAQALAAALADLSGETAAWLRGQLPPAPAVEPASAETSG